MHLQVKMLGAIEGATLYHWDRDINKLSNREGGRIEYH